MSQKADDSLNCPACTGTFPFKMVESDSAVILKCPLCGSTLLFYSGVSFCLSKDELAKILKSKNLEKVCSVFDRVNTARNNKKAVKIVRFEPVHISKREALLSGEGGLPVRKNPIGKDEVIDLIIDLNTSVSVEDFLARL
jgi:hypothetical protein